MDAATRRIEIELPAHAADALEARVRSGEYESASEAVLAGLESLEHHEEPLTEAEIELFRAGYLAWKANPEKVYSIEEIEERHIRNRDLRS